MADLMLDTASQREATGMDEGARKLIFRAAAEVGGLDARTVVNLFFHDRFGGPEDYLRAVEQVWGEAESFRLSQLIGEAGAEAEFPIGFGQRKVDPIEVRAYVLLMHAPEPDFRLAIQAALEATKKVGAASDRITQICRSRGIPWAFSHLHGFEYVGDEQVERDLVRPALAAINRPEFAGGVRTEFESARAELAKGTPEALKQAIHEAGCCLESAMKVVLGAHGIPYNAGDTAQPLFNHLEDAGIVPRHMEKLVLVAMTPRNRRGGHGAGAEAHAVSPSEAGAVVAGAGGAVAYLASALP
jgi:hypothetical protein